MHNADPEQGKLVPVQALRAIAAVLVLAAHADLCRHHLGRFLGIDLPAGALAAHGGFGVDLFFAISGFVMVVSSRGLAGLPGARRTFLLRRLARIVPMYWGATLVEVAWLVRTHTPPRADAVGWSLLFVPWRAAPDARVVPVLEVGWTLAYEMLFYALFAAALTRDLPATARRLAAMIAALVALRLLVPLPLPFSAWTRPILLEFLGGVGIGLAWLRGVRLPAPLRLALVAGAGALAILGTIDPANDLAGWSRVATLGLAGMALLAATVLGPLRLPAPRLWLAGGDISYALYLVHMPIQAMVQFGWRYGRFAGWGPLQDTVFALLAVALPIAVAALVHYCLEAPFTAWLGARIPRPASAVPADRPQSRTLNCRTAAPNDLDP